MFYVFIERPITGSCLQETLQNASHQLPIQPVIPWTIVYPGEEEQFYSISSWCRFISTLTPYDLFIKSIQFNPDDWVFYITIPYQDYNQQSIFNIHQAKDWRWIFQALPTIFMFVQNNTKNMEHIYHLSLHYLVHDVDSHFLLTYFHSFTHPDITNQPIQTSFQELPTYLGIPPNEEPTILQQWKDELYPLTPGFFYWQHPHFILTRIIQSFPSIKNKSIESILQNIQEEEYFHWKKYQKDLLPHIGLYHLFFPHQEPTFPRQEPSSNPQPSIYFFHSSYQKQIQSHFPHALYRQTKDTLFKIDISKWKPYIHYVFSKKIPSITLQESHKLYTLIQALHDFCRPLPYHSVHVIHPFRFHRVPPIFLWFPFQEEYNHTLIKNQEDTSPLSKTIQEFKHNHRITSHTGQVRTYFKQLQMGFRFVHLHRTTDWAELNEEEWWDSSKKTYTFPYQTDLLHKTVLNVYQTEHARFSQEYVLIWVWDCFSVPFIYSTSDVSRLSQWKDFIKQLWIIILQQKEYGKIQSSHSNEKSPILYVAIPSQGWELFHTLWEEVFSITPQLQKITWRFVSNYPLRNQKEGHTMTLTSCAPPFPINERFDKNNIDFCSIPTPTLIQWKEAVYRVPYRLDSYDLVQWILWFRCIEQSWAHLSHKRPILHTALSTIQWNQSPWNQWFLVWKKNEMNVSFKKELLEVAYKAQKANLPLLFLQIPNSTIKKNGETEKKGWRGTVWDFCGEDDASGCLMNCCMMGEHFRDVEPITIEKCLKVYKSLQSTYPDRFPEWFPSKFLDSSRDVPSRMATQ